MIDLTLRRYWLQLSKTEDVRVVQEAADTTEHLLSSETNRVRLDAAMTEARPILAGVRSAVPVEQILARATGPAPGGISGLSDQEAESFLKAIEF